jgi:hypothetical protein
MLMTFVTILVLLMLVAAGIIACRQAGPNSASPPGWVAVLLICLAMIIYIVVEHAAGKLG